MAARGILLFLLVAIGSLLVQARSPLRLGIVIPFAVEDTHRIRNTWKVWSETSPCSDHSVQHDVTLVMYVDWGLDVEPEAAPTDANAKDASAKAKAAHPLINAFDVPTAIQTIRNLWQELPLSVHRCFSGGMQVVFSDLPRSPSIHDRSCPLAYSIFSHLEDMNLDYFFTLQPYVIPVQSGWLDSVYNQMVPKTNPKQCGFWQKGGDLSALGLDEHNAALFCLGDPNFAKFRANVQEFFPATKTHAAGCVTDKEKEVGFLRAMYRYRVASGHVAYSRQVLHRFVSHRFVQDLSSAEVSSAVLFDHSLFFVRSEWAFLSTEHKIIYRSFRRVLGRSPSEKELLTFSTRLGLQELSEDDLVWKLCNGREWSLAGSKPRVDVCQPYFYSPSSSSSPVSEPPMLPKPELEQAHSDLVPWSEKWPGKFYMWTNDFHPSPLVCNGKLYADLGVVTHAEIDFGHCIYFELCRDRLKVLKFDHWKGFSLDPCPNKLRRDFFEAYKADPEMQRIDLFICSHPVANCELFMPFNRSMIIYPTTRLEFGRNDGEIDWRKPYMNERNPIRWKQWLANLHAIAANPRNIIAANNMYDAMYIKYFTGLDAIYLPSWCGDVDVSYAPSRTEILIGPSRDNLDARCESYGCKPWEHPMMKDLTKAIMHRQRVTGKKTTILRTRDLYKHFSFEQISRHPAMIIFPYQISVMTIFEVYRHNIPIFVPSQKFLLEWHVKYDFLFERVYGHPERPATFPKTPKAVLPKGMPTLHSMPFILRGRDSSDLTQPDEDTLDKMKKKVRKHPELQVIDDRNMPNPNSDDPEAFAYWAQFHDYYLWPHVQYFDSWDELLRLLNEVDLAEISRKMQRYNKDLRQDLLERWRDVFARAFYGDTPGSRVVPQDYDQAMLDLYHGKADPIYDPDPEVCYSSEASRSMLGRSGALGFPRWLILLLSLCACVALVRFVKVASLRASWQKLRLRMIHARTPRVRMQL